MDPKLAPPSTATETPPSATTDVSVDQPPQQEVLVVEEPAPKPKVIAVPTHAMKKIKSDAAAEGRTAFQKELDAQAQQLGYKDHADLQEAARALRAPPQTPAQATPQAATPEASPSGAGMSEVDRLRDENTRLSKERDTALQEKKRSNRQFAKQKRELERAQERLLNQETESELKLAAKEAGVQDVDYAVTVLNRAIQGLSEEELKGFNESKFFKEDLRKSHPHLYVPVEKPLNTGVKSDPKITAPGNGPGAPPAPGGGQKQGSVKDARTMTPDEFKALLRSKGLNPPGSGGMLA